MLNDMWSFIEIFKPGQTVNIVTEPENPDDAKINSSHEGQVLTVSADKNLVILNPDHMISTTDLSTSFFCQRKSFLTQKFTSMGKSNEAMLLGSLIHDLFQQAMLLKLTNLAELESKVKEILRSPEYLKSLIACGCSDHDLFIQSKPYIENYLEWANLAVRDKNNSSQLQPKLFSPKRKLKAQNEGNLESFDIEDIIGIETNVWSPR